MVDVKTLVDSVRNTFNSGKTKDVAFRETQLKNLLKLYKENAPYMNEALKADLNKSEMESAFTEVNILINDLENIIRNLKNWVKPTNPEKELANILDEILIYNDPYGVILIISTWNYPLQVSLLPLASAIAAGNCFILKPSELAPNSSALIMELIPRYLDPDCYKVVVGGPDVSTALLAERFDYIFFTGSTQIGRIVHAAANKYLTPVTLELGGKSPVYIHDSADIVKTAYRVMWGKCLNAGQTCIAPDYVLCSKKIESLFINACRKVLLKFYGSNPQNSPDFCRIINEKHFDRLTNLMQSGRIVIGGKTDRKNKYIAPTVITNIRPNDLIMQEEIFGPILPIIIVKNEQEAIDFVNSREKPLALYVFAKDRNIINNFMKKTTAGGVTVNDIAMHFTVDSLPFGGVGFSGMGAYHGKHTFDLFTHKKSTLIKNFNGLGEKLLSIRYPPYSKTKLYIITLLLKKYNFPLFKYMPFAVMFALGFACSNFIRNRRK